MAKHRQTKGSRSHGDWVAYHQMTQLPIKPKAVTDLVPDGFVGGEMTVKPVETDASKKARAEWDAKMKKIQDEKAAREKRNTATNSAFEAKQRVLHAMEIPAKPGQQTVQEQNANTQQKVILEPKKDPDGTPRTAAKDPSAGSSFGYAPRQGKGQNAQYTMNGQGIDPSNTYEKGFRDKVVRHQSQMFSLRAQDEKDAYLRQREADRQARLNATQAKWDKYYADKNYEGRKFSSQKGWDNLAREGDARGQAIQGYDDRMKMITGRMDQLTEAFKNGDFTGRGREFAAIRKAVEQSAANGGLTGAQMDAIEKKMDFMRDGLNAKAKFANDKNEYYAKRQMQNMRDKVGAGGAMASAYTDDQVKQMYTKQLSGGLRDLAGEFGEASKKFGEASKAYAGRTEENAAKLQQGVTDTMGPMMDARNGVIQYMRDNAIDTNKVFQAALQSASPEVRQKLLEANKSGDKQTFSDMQDTLVSQFVMNNLDVAKDGSNAAQNKTLMDLMIPGQGTPTPQNAILEWNDQKKPEAPAAGPAAIPPAAAPAAPAATPAAPAAAPAAPAIPPATPAPGASPIEPKKPNGGTQ